MDSIDSLNTETIIIRTGESSLRDTTFFEENKNEGSDDESEDESDKNESNEKGGGIGIQMFAFKSLVATHVNFANDKFEPLPILDDYPNETYGNNLFVNYYYYYSSPVIFIFKLFIYNLR
jgi:hypothetical protein